MSDTFASPGRGRPRKRSKSDVAEVAMRAYWDEGPTEVSLNAICARAGVSKPSVYRDFGNDDGLAHAALERYVDTVLAKMVEITAGDETFSGKIRKLAFLSAEDEIHQNGCLFVKMRSVESRMGPKTRALIAGIESMALDAFTEIFAEGRASGEWPGSIPPDLAARYLHAQIGLALDQRARGRDPADVLDLALSVLTRADT